MNLETALQDILKRFPYEVWSKCILNAIYRAPEGPLPLLSVSSHWQNLLLDSPEMWTYIHIDDGEDVVVRVHTFLHLSRLHPLELAIAFFGSLWASMVSIIALHKDRIHSVHILQSFISRNNKKIGPWRDIVFPAVRTIEANKFAAYAPEFEPLLVLCPNLQYSASTVFGNGGDPKWIRPNFRAINGSFVAENFESLMTSAQPILDLPGLELLFLLLDIRDVKAETSSRQYPPDTFVLSSKPVQFLQLYTNIRTILQRVLNSSFKQLSTLIVGIPPRNLDIAINILRTLPSLQDIFLTFPYSDSETRTTSYPLLWPSDIPMLRSLHIFVYVDLGVPFDVLLDIFTRNDALLGVEVFVFRGGRLDSIQLVNPLRLLHSLRNTHHITLPAFEFQEVDISTDLGFKVPVHMPNLLRLQIQFSALISFIEAPSLHSLKVKSLPKALLEPLHLPSYFARHVATLEVTGGAFNQMVIQKADHWDSVKNIRWKGQDPLIGVKTTTFRSICSVKLIGGHSTEQAPNITHSLNNFLVALLRYPDACPHLRTIKSDKYPVWALLTQVLLERNQSHDLVQLEEIWLPSLPVRPLLSLIVRLLNGSSNEAVPMKIDRILVRRYQHTLFPGCFLCISAGYTDCLDPRCALHPDDLTIWWQEIEDGLKYDRRSDPVYIELLDLGLETKMDEADPRLNWIEWENNLENMEVSWKEPRDKYSCWGCERHEREGLGRIHKYIL